MNEDSSTKCWNELNVDWIEKAQTNDFRMYYLIPNTLHLLGDVNGKKILDLGCGEGGYSRKLAEGGAIVTGADCAQEGISYAEEKAKQESLAITYLKRNSNNLYGVEDNTFDIVLCGMMIMDVEDMEGTLAEVYRVLKPGGSVLISVLHPCFKSPVEHKWFHEEDGIQVRIKNYFSPNLWEGQILGCENKVIYRHKTLSEYVKAFVKQGFILSDMNEPIPTPEQIRMSPRIEWLTKIPMFLFMTLYKL